MSANKRLSLEALNVLQYHEGPIPNTPPGGAVVKVAYAGICHSDVHILHKLYHPKFTFPRVLGHEISGTIYSIGDQATKARPELHIGDNVCVFPWGMCQNCNNCKSDCTYCPTMHYGAGPTDSYVYGVWKDGGYQNYVAVDLIKFLEPVPSNVQLDQAAILTCSGVTSLNAVRTLRDSINRAIEVNGIATVGLVGVGGLALWAIQIIKATYPNNVKVVAIDINDDKLEDAIVGGADVRYKWGTQEPALEAANELIKHVSRLDGVIDFIGLAPVIERCHLSLNLGGTMCLVGLSGNEMPPMALSSIIRRNVSIKGVIVGSQPQCRELLKMVDDGKIRPPPISHVGLDDVERVLNLLKEGKQRGRAVVKM